MDLNVAILGGGSWGTTVAHLISRNTHAHLWARNPDTVQEINTQHTNQTYLPGAVLSPKLRASDDIEDVVKYADVVVMAVPSQHFRSVLTRITSSIRPWVPVISLTKGLEMGSNLRMTELIHELLPGHPAGVLTGPNLAREIMAGQAAASVIAMKDPIIMRALQKVFSSGLFRCYTNPDVIGCELGGVLKNVIAIAVGMGDGLGAGDNTRSALITRGLSEISRLGVALGGQAETFAGLAGMGDMIATCTSDQSRNRRVGMELAQGRTVDQITDGMFMVAEGLKSAPVVLELAAQNNIQMPIVEDVFKVITGESSPSRIFKGLLRVTAGAEPEPG